MLSRRNIRIKVMQMLYTISRDKELSYKEALDRYEEGIQDSFILFLFNLNYFVHVTRYSVRDGELRHAKHLPTEEDKIFSAKLYNNPLIQTIIKQEDFLALAEKSKFDDYVDEDNVRKLYSEFSKTEDYKAYLQSGEEESDHKKVLLTLFKHCNGHELYNEAIEDRFSTWIDDKSLVVGTMKKTIKGLPKQNAFMELYKPTDETSKEFGEALLENVSKKDAELLEIIEPVLNNWDADRVAIIDMILLKMAISELLIFPSIPTKVTLNEYLEISKLYSTDKSKDFINGILDRLMKNLEKDGKIKKEGRGLVE